MHSNAVLLKGSAWRLKYEICVQVSNNLHALSISQLEAYSHEMSSLFKFGLFYANIAISIKLWLEIYIPEIFNDYKSVFKVSIFVIFESSFDHVWQLEISSYLIASFSSYPS